MSEWKYEEQSKYYFIGVLSNFAKKIISLRWFTKKKNSILNLPPKFFAEPEILIINWSLPKYMHTKIHVYVRQWHALIKHF